MALDADLCYRALAARDARFDGRFFVGVRSTGVYCRPVCHARTPLAKNCTFYELPALAEQAGYRPCRLCRPELAPGRSRVDAVRRIAETAVRWIEEGYLDEASVSDLAAEFGVTDRHLRRVILERYGVTPLELGTTARLLTAKGLLTDTGLPIGEVALASGFGSVRRMNAAFQGRYQLPPSAFRRREARVDEVIQVRLAFRPPYAWEAALDHFRGRAIPGVEHVADGRYRRTVRERDRTGWVSVELADGALLVRLSSGLASRLPQIVRRIRRQFDTEADPVAIDAALGELAAREPGLRVIGAFDPFESAIKAVLGQQISVAGARTIAGRLAAAFGEPVETPWDELRFSFPTAATLASASEGDLAGLGMVGAKARTLIALARAVESGQVNLRPGGDPESATAALVALPGIGPWTAQYIAMRVLGDPDAFPASDLGLMKALDTRDPKVAEAASQAWRPWRAYAAMHLWRMP